MIANFLRGGVLQPKQLAASDAARLCDLPVDPNKVGFGGAQDGGCGFLCGRAGTSWSRLPCW
ncbi:MAG: hypothetical protein ACRYFS_19905 [Janthinobacterium lividum]